MASTRVNRKFDLSGGVQTATSRLLSKPNELRDVRNATFSSLIGAVSRRLGYSLYRTVQSGKDGLGAFVHRFSTGTRLYAATNNSGDTATVIKYDNGSGMTDLGVGGIAANTRVSSINFLDEAYVVGATSSGTFMTPINIDSTPAYSTTRNVLNMPKAKWIAEFQGSLYAINVEVSGTKYPDRAYKSSPAQGVITFVRTDQSSATMTSMKVDSVRYLKAGMAIDIYDAGTETKLYDITISSVDKAANTIAFSSANITVTDNDEIWLDGRKGKLSVAWNTDYPTPESSDYLRIPPGQDEDSSITGWAKTTNRLILFTQNSMTKWDGANLITVSNTIGCIQHECIRQIGSWIIWPHYTGIWAYNDSTGQLKLISRGIKDWLKAIPLTNWSTASAVAIDNIYKISVGSGLTLNNQSIQGSIRFVYDFDMNIWSIESHTRNQRFQFTWTVSSVRNPYFQDDNGLIIKDEDGYLDISASIPWSIETGRDNFSIDELKSYQTVYIYANAARGLQIQYQIDGKDWKTLGELKSTVQKFEFPLNTEGHDINFRFALNAPGEPPVIEGISTHYSVLEGYYAK